MSSVTRAGMLRLLLLAMVAAGVVQMHVLGHVGGGHGLGVVAPAGHEMVAAEMPVGVRAEDGTAPEDPSGSWDPLAICLAVLTAAGAVVAAVLLLGRAAGVVVLLRGQWLWRGTWRGRGPPSTAPPLGWRIADLSVLRI